MILITRLATTLLVLTTATTGTENCQRQITNQFHLIKIRPKSVIQTIELASTSNRYGDDKLIFLQDLKPKTSNQVLVRADILETFESVLRNNRISYKNKGESRVKSIQLWPEEEQPLRNTTRVNMLQSEPMGMAGCKAVYKGGIQQMCTRYCIAVPVEDQRWCFTGAIPACGDPDSEGEYQNCAGKYTCNAVCSAAGSPANCVDSC